MTVTRPLITFMTDFGTADGYTGIVKGVIKSIAPECDIIDITHDIPSFSISSAAWILQNSYQYFPEQTVHLIVVDPGVGTPRTGVIAQTGKQYFIAPDNGLLTPILDLPDLEVWDISAPSFWLEKISSTFHGRDIFGPVAAHLSVCFNPARFGKTLELSTLQRLSTPELSVEHGRVRGEVVYIDRFGNLITNILAHAASGAREISIADSPAIPFSLTYGSVAPGQATAFAGSHGYVEVALNQGAAAAHFNANIGSKVNLLLSTATQPEEAST